MSNSQKRILLLSPRTNLIVLTIVLFSAAFIPIALSRFYVDPDIVSAVRTILYIILGIMLGGTVLQYLLIYLEPKNTYENKGLEKSVENSFYPLSDQIKQLNYLLQDFSKVKVEVKDISKDELLESLKLTIDQKFTEKLFTSVDEELAKRDLQNKRWERFITGFEEIRKRLYEETNNLARRANINLYLGTITTILSGIGLVYIVFGNPLILPEAPKDTNIPLPPYGWIVAAHYIPRLSLIIFAQLFAYFFLRLYKSGLDDIKYYQNEITNVELKISALKVALTIEENEILKPVIEELAKVERNFILKKDETTVELEKFKAESFNAKDLLTQINSLLETKNKSG